MLRIVAQVYGPLKFSIAIHVDILENNGRLRVLKMGHEMGHEMQEIYMEQIEDVLTS